MGRLLILAFALTLPIAADAAVVEIDCELGIPVNEQTGNPDSGYGPVFFRLQIDESDDAISLVGEDFPFKKGSIALSNLTSQAVSFAVNMKDHDGSTYFLSISRSSGRLYVTIEHGTARLSTSGICMVGDTLF